MEPILEVKNLKKEFKDFSLKNINFSLEKGYIMGFIGPNGAGKTTTIKLIMNLIKKDEGEIKVFGMDNVKYEREIKNRVGFIYDESCFYEELTVEEMKGIIAPFYNNWDDKAFYGYVKKFSLPLRKKMGELSKGMKVKFSLAVALSHNADLLILDEPTSGLDPIFRNELLEILTSFIQDENKAVLFSTHITSDLDKIADFITFINDGVIEFSCPKDEIYEKYAIVKGPKEMLKEDIICNFIGIKENNFGFEGLIKDKTVLKNHFFKDRVIFEKPTLDDIMFYFIRRGRNVQFD